MAYLPFIDGLRAVAIAGVIIYHAMPHALPGGFAGVDVFFVISGFLITRFILEEMSYPLSCCCLMPIGTSGEACLRQS